MCTAYILYKIYCIWFLDIKNTTYTYIYESIEAYMSSSSIAILFANG